MTVWKKIERKLWWKLHHECGKDKRSLDRSSLDYHTVLRKILKHPWAKDGQKRSPHVSQEWVYLNIPTVFSHVRKQPIGSARTQQMKSSVSYAPCNGWSAKHTLMGTHTTLASFIYPYSCKSQLRNFIFYGKPFLTPNLPLVKVYLPFYLLS